MFKRRSVNYHNAGWFIFASVIWYLGMSTVMGFIGGLMQGAGGGLELSGSAYYLFTAVTELALAVPLIAYMLINKMPIRAMMGKKPKAKQVILGGIIGILAAPAVMCVTMLWSAIVTALGGGQVVAEVAMPANLGELVVGMLCIGVTAAIVEEPMYRGIVQRGLAGRFSKWPALLLTAALFALFHFNFEGLPTLFLVGLLLGILTWETGSLWPSIAMHAGYNMTVLGQAYFLTWLGEKLPVMLDNLNRYMTDNGLPPTNIPAVDITNEAVSAGALFSSAISWFFIVGIPTILGIALCFFFMLRRRRAQEYWTALPWERTRKWWHWIPWILFAGQLLYGLFSSVMMSFGLMEQLPRMIEIMTDFISNMLP